MVEHRADALRGGPAFGGDQHAGVRLGAAGDAHLVAEQLAAHVRQRERVLGEARAPAGALDRRQPRIDGDAVGGELVFARHLALGHFVQHQVQPQAQLAAAERGHRIGGAADHAAHRAFADVVEENRGRSFGAALHEQVRFRIGHAGQGHLHVGELDAENRAAAPGDVDLVAVEGEVALDLFDARPAARIVEHGARHLGGNLELALGRIEEGEIAQVALQTQARVGGLALEHALRHPFARTLAHDGRERQVAPGAFAVGARKLRREVDRARPFAAPGIVAVGSAGEIVVGEVQVREAHRESGRLVGGLVGRLVRRLFRHCDRDLGRAGIALPADFAVQGFQRDARLREDARQVQVALARGQLHRAFLLVRLDAARHVGEARHAVPGVHGQPREAGLGDEHGAIGQLAFPVELDVLQVALRPQLGEQRAQVRGKRQELRQVREWAQLDQLGLDRAALRERGAARRLPAGAKAGGVHFRRARPRERQAAHAEIVAAGGFAPVHAAAHVGDLQHRQVARQARADVQQRHVRRGLGDPARGECGPQAQRAVAAAHVDRVVHPGAPAGEIGRAELGIDAPAPVRQLPHARAGEPRAHFQPGPELARRARRESGGVLVAVVLQPEIQRRELERRRLARLVLPFDLGAAHDDLALAEDPVGELAVALLAGDADPGHVELAAGVAPHRELGSVDEERVQAQLAREQRAPGAHVLYRGQHQRLAAVAVVDAHVRDRQPRPQALPVGAERADLDRQPDRARDRGDDVLPVVLDVRQQPVAQRQQDDRKGEECRPGEDLQRTQQVSERGSHCRSESSCILAVNAGSDSENCPFTLRRAAPCRASGIRSRGEFGARCRPTVQRRCNP